MARFNHPTLLAAAGAALLLLYSSLTFVIFQNSRLTSKIERGSLTNALLQQAIDRSYLHDAVLFRKAADKLQYFPHDPQVLKQSYESALLKAPGNYQNFLSFAFYSASLKCCGQRTLLLIHEAVKRKPIDARIQRAAGSLLLTKDQRSDAFRFFHQAISLNHEMANDIYRILERNGGTVDDLIQITPKRIETLVKLFSFLSAKRNPPEDLLQYLLQELDRLDLKPEERLLAANTALDSRYIDWAKIQTSKTLEYPGTRMEALKMLSRIEAQKENWAEFENYSNQVVEAYRERGDIPGAASYALEMATTLSAIEGSDKTADRLKTIIDKYPRYAPTYFALAELRQKEMPELALFFLQESVRLDPYNFKYSSKLAERYVEISMITEAEAIYERFLRIPKFALGAYLGLAECKQQAGRPQEAISVLQQARKRHGKSILLLQELGRYYEAQSDYYNAAETYKAFAALTPKKAIGQILIADMYQKAGDSSAAIKHYQQALKIAPNNKEARRGLSTLQTTSP